MDADVLAHLHDDLEILEEGWDEKVIDFFTRYPKVGLAGFGGGTGLGDDNIYQVPYNPMQLARKDFVSNMRDAEAHGRRAHTGSDHRWGFQPERVACLDGFSQIGRADFWRGIRQTHSQDPFAPGVPGNLFAQMASWGVIHHFYDGMLGCFAKRLGWEAWMLPIACHHYGGRTAVGDARYQSWANQHPHTKDAPDVMGDQLFWIQAHRIGYEQFRDVLPIRV
jgi:hypothetical protein